MFLAPLIIPIFPKKPGATPHIVKPLEKQPLVKDKQELFTKMISAVEFNYSWRSQAVQQKQTGRFKTLAMDFFELDDAIARLSLGRSHTTIRDLEILRHSFSIASELQDNVLVQKEMVAALEKISSAVGTLERMANACMVLLGFKDITISASSLSPSFPYLPNDIYSTISFSHIYDDPNESQKTALHTIALLAELNAYGLVATSPVAGSLPGESVASRPAHNIKVSIPPGIVPVKTAVHPKNLYSTAHGYQKGIENLRAIERATGRLSKAQTTKLRQLEQASRELQRRLQKGDFHQGKQPCKGQPETCSEQPRQPVEQETQLQHAAMHQSEPQMSPKSIVKLLTLFRTFGKWF